jgi:hypothetical protein
MSIGSEILLGLKIGAINSHTNELNIIIRNKYLREYIFLSINERIRLI